MHYCAFIVFLLCLLVWLVLYRTATNISLKLFCNLFLHASSRHDRGFDRKAADARLRNLIPHLSTVRAERLDFPSRVVTAGNLFCNSLGKSIFRHHSHNNNRSEYVWDIYVTRADVLLRWQHLNQSVMRSKTKNWLTLLEITVRNTDRNWSIYYTNVSQRKYTGSLLSRLTIPDPSSNVSIWKWKQMHEVMDERRFLFSIFTLSTVPWRKLLRLNSRRCLGNKLPRNTLKPKRRVSCIVVLFVS